MGRRNSHTYPRHWPCRPLRMAAHGLRRACIGQTRSGGRNGQRIKSERGIRTRQRIKDRSTPGSRAMSRSLFMRRVSFGSLIRHPGRLDDWPSQTEKPGNVTGDVGRAPASDGTAVGNEGQGTRQTRVVSRWRAGNPRNPWLSLPPPGTNFFLSSPCSSWWCPSHCCILVLQDRLTPPARPLARVISIVDAFLFPVRPR